MAPEARAGDPVPANDVYASAVVLHEMLTGRHPWARGELLSGARARGDFRPPADITRGAPPALVAALTDHLDRVGDPDPARRPSTDDALAEAQVLRDQALAAGLP
jgi:serine/threonine protein kinase